MVSNATFSAENRIAEGMRRLGISALFLCALGDYVSSTRLNHALSGVKALQNHQSGPLLELVNELLEIAEEHAPYPIRFENPALFRQLLAERRAKKAAL
jgi:hypothetical protein